MSELCTNENATFYLLQKVRESGFDKIIRNLANTDIIYVGSSAGSVIAGSDISVAGWEKGDPNHVGLTDTRGLSLVPYSFGRTGME